ncbi:MAG: ABC transporter ATP-binding protein/permease [Clostridiaceae bacterium]|nr:ABC transporter ATP-binding protein/permease [Clostridiaceae bacterium]MBW4860764.1 ABC transporter ATP-binding protein/permease [Clostridiaceae bacterium]MBW4868982.1 ABC transporter ATP-binding protein/permease [Clostridiaceae bacterium]
MKEESSKIKFSPPKDKERLLSYIMKYHRQFLITAISGIFFNSAIVLGPIFQGKLLDVAANSSNIKSIIKAGFEFVGVTLAFQIARFFKRYFVRDMANRMSGDMRVGIMESILYKDLSILEKQKIGDMMSTTIGDVDIVVEAVRKTITELWDTWVLMAAYWIALMYYDCKITLIATIPIPLVIVLTQLMKKTVHSHSKEARKSTANTTTQIRKMISEVNILRLYGREEAEIERLENKLSKQADKNVIVNIFKNGLAPIYSVLASLGIIVVIFLGGNKVIDGSWTIGIFTAYIAMFIALATRTTTAAKVFNIQQGAKASWDRVLWLMDNENSMFFNKIDSLRPRDIYVENLSFKYPNNDEYAIKDISFKISSGMIVGITGSVGSGKSALALALTGLYDYEGKILLDNVNLNGIGYEQKLATITYMGHDPFLFSDTLKSNITWNDKNDKKLDKVLTIASLKQDIESFENSIDTQVGEKGVKVSGGQKQRIALARALYKDANIVILDDPFSAVDINTEAKIIKKLRENVGDRIIFIFSHRLDAFKYTDMILVLDKGKIVQKGSHDKLISVDGIYSKIIDSQQFLGDESIEK